MILDTQNLFSDSQAITVTADSTNVIDLGAASRDISVGGELDILIQVMQAFTAAGAATLQTQVITSDDSGFATGNVTVFDSGAVAKATLVAGYQIRVGQLQGPVKRYLKLVFTVATGPMTAGKVTGGLLMGLQQWKPFSAPFQA
jgi:hypothetical protein